ncbi:MAG: hypothetical protein IPL49_21265 [Saprospirales bacterium]|nr:hypothetical protein [Saprospirales bacterium]MBK8493337.1 hypothetical protein [Saprospirales bacterium]
MRIFLFFLFMGLSTQAFTNAAQPGIWNAGGAGTFFLLYPEDSLSFQQIQMVQEQVKIQLYQGFAVVKGVYQMHNPTADTLFMRVGYPINASYAPSNGYRLTQVRFDDLYDLRVLVRGKPVQVALSEVEVNAPGLDAGGNWYVWESRFNPGEITTLEVNFVVNTNDASVLEGYNKGHYNAFIYLLESGSTWKQPIGKGVIMIQLMDGLTIQDIHGLIPAGRFQVNEEANLLMWNFDQLTPTNQDNPIITYGKRREAFDFAAVLSNGAQDYYRTIHRMNSGQVANMALQPHDFGDPFDPGTSTGGVVVGILFFLSMFGIPLLLIIGVLILGVFLYRKFRKPSKL